MSHPLGPADVDVQARVRFAHAALARLATRAGVDLLHIKGPAVPATLAAGLRFSHDADVLVRPRHIPLLTSELAEQGWQQRDAFETGSPFGHAMTMFHEVWGFADIHRFVPGVALEPDRAFEVLWAERRERLIAATRCSVPADPAHRLILLLNAAKGGLRTVELRNDVLACWTYAAEPDREQVGALVTTLDAAVAFSIITGTLEHHREHPSYPVWAHAAYGGTRAQEWWARIRAAPNAREALVLAARAGLVNTDHLRMTLGREPTRVEVVREFLARPRHAVREALHGRRSR